MMKFAKNKVVTYFIHNKKKMFKKKKEFNNAYKG